MSKEMREQIDKFKDFLLNEGKKVDLNKKYGNVIFSDDFYKKDVNTIKYLKKTYLTKIDDFIKFYKKYKPKGVRIIHGIDVYEESKSVFDKVVNGEIHIDEVFRNPDNPLRNIVMLLHIDEPILKRKLGVSVRYFKCSKCGHKIQTTNDDSGFLCQQPMPFRTSGICAGSYDIEISEAEFNAR